jgi:hypothetical protein
MAYNTQKIITDVDGNPISQYYDPDTDTYNPVEGKAGANKVVLYNADGTVNNSLSLIPILEKLSQLTGTVIDEETRKANEISRNNNEEDRQSNEDIRNRNEIERVELEDIRVLNEEIRESNENTRKENELDRVNLYEDLIEKLSSGYFDGKNLEFHWRGTELGVRVEGDIDYIYVDLKGETGSIDNLNAEHIKEALGYIPADEAEIKDIEYKVIESTSRIIDVPEDVEEGIIKLNIEGNTVVTENGVHSIDGLKIISEDANGENQTYTFISEGLHSLPNGVKDVLEGNKLTRRIDKTIIDGSFNYDNFTVTTNVIYARIFNFISDYNATYTTNYLGYSDDLGVFVIKLNSHVEDSIPQIVVQGNSIWAVIPKVKITDQTLIGFKDYLNINPIDLVYQLNIPEIKEIDLSALVARKNGQIRLENWNKYFVKKEGLKQSDQFNVYLAGLSIPNMEDAISYAMNDDKIMISGREQIARTEDGNFPSYDIGKYYVAGRTLGGGDVWFILQKGTTLEQAKQLLVGTSIYYKVASEYEVTPSKWSVKIPETLKTQVNKNSNSIADMSGLVVKNKNLIISLDERYNNLSKYGFMNSIGKGIPNRDYNNATEVGWYHGSGDNSINAPPGDLPYGMLLVQQRYDSRIIQIAIYGDSVATRMMAISTGVWYEWVKLITNKPIPWINATLQNGWTGNLRYRLTPLEQLEITFAMDGGVISSLTTIAILPIGYRPTRGIPIDVIKSSSGAVVSGALFINADGSIKISTGTVLESSTRYVGGITLPI